MFYRCSMITNFSNAFNNDNTKTRVIEIIEKEVLKNQYDIITKIIETNNKYDKNIKMLKISGYKRIELSYYRALNILIKKRGYKEAADFYRDIVEEKVEVNDLIDTYVDLQKHEMGQGERAAARSAELFSMDSKVAQSAAPREASDDVLVIDKNLKGLEFCMAPCCSPVYGDEVFGFVTSSGGIKIHRTSCPNAPQMMERYPYRLVRARWAGKGGRTYPALIYVIGQDDLGIVNNLTSIISKEQKVMLRNISIESRDGLFYGELTVMIEDTSALDVLIRKLRDVKGVKAVSR